MEYTKIANTDLKVSRIGLGTWGMGGWMWGGSDEPEAIRTIHVALESGINLIDTAPVYGFGKSEEIVGKADRKSTRLNSSHDQISYAVFCLKKKTTSAP